MSRENYPQYYLYGELDFPYADRVYFDYIGTEFQYNSIQQKLLDIGYMLWHGYDVKAMIHRTYNAHQSVTEDNVRYTICILLGNLLQTEPIKLSLKYENLSTNRLIDVFFSYLISYYHMKPTGDHFLKSPQDLTESELKSLNPWLDVVEKYEGSKFLYSKANNLVCDSDKEIIEEFNKRIKQEEYEYKLNVPPYPWYGNPLKANVIVLSLNPGYVDKESVIARVIQYIPERYAEGYTEHLRKMLTLDCREFLPQELGAKGMTYRDLANLHQSWYWEDRLTNAFVNDETGLNFDEINMNFAVIQYIGYSSKKYAPLKNGILLPSQLYTRQLIEFILKNNAQAIFIVARNVKMWQHFLGSLWDENKNRFIVSKDYLGQRYTKNILGEAAFAKVIEAFKS